MQYNIDDFLAKTLASMPKSAQAYWLGKLAQTSKRDILYITSQGVDMSNAKDLIEYMYPDLDVLQFPAWDTVPYDRVSPSREIVAKRVETLSRLALSPMEKKGRVIVTSIGAVLQKLPHKRIFINSVKQIKVGSRLNFNEFVHYAVMNGYSKVEQVFEAGEYALRGDIIDIFPIDSVEPLRIDLFDDEIERIRKFDVMTQRTTGELKEYNFNLASEVVLDENTVASFRKNYREAFGSVGCSDEIYAAISEKSKYIGMENWLPFFYDNQLMTLFDYLPNAVIVFSDEIDQAMQAKQESIVDYYKGRVDNLSIKSNNDMEVYRPINPQDLYLMPEQINDILRQKQAIALTEMDYLKNDKIIDMQCVPMRSFVAPQGGSIAQTYDELRKFLTDKNDVTTIIACYSLGSRERLYNLLSEHGFSHLQLIDNWNDALNISKNSISLVIMPLLQGFKGMGLNLISEADILGEKLVRRKPKKPSSKDFIADISSMSVGELVVHIDHGIGRFLGLETLVVDGAGHDCLKIEYAGNSKLFVPVENLDVLSRYGADNDNIELDVLGGSAWSVKKARVKNKIRDIAEKLIKIAAERKLKKAEIFLPKAGAYDDFCARFPYNETDDQQNAIDDVVEDLAKGMPMDRLVCGDVGFGKTEVAMRAAFVVAASGGQVALIVPTTLLARQHYQNFKKRFEGFPIKIKMLSRLVSAKEATETFSEMKDGTVDIVIGTHALLSKKVEFANLGLLIIDEEQHFGVVHKEKLKNLKSGVHVLTMTATPIPRTLQLSLTGVKNLSVITTAPVDRLAVRSFVMPFDKVMIKEAIMREKNRGGQTFFVCPRVLDIAETHNLLEEMVPDAKISVAHGQMPAKQLEEIMNDFSVGKSDVLLSTTIIESGIDMPQVNTMIVHRSDMFGLAQLYQLKGRIGRSKIRGYAYFTVPNKRKVTPTAMKRLNILQSLDVLGAGFSLASYDMDIRGSGNVLGEEQSGHIKDVGISLYEHLLEEEINRLKAEEANNNKPLSVKDWAPQINIGIPIMIPEDYVSDLGLRLGLYKRIGDIADKEEIADIREELIDRFGNLPKEVDNLLTVVEIKLMCLDGGIDRINAGAKGFLLGFHNNVFKAPDKLMNMIIASFGVIKVRPDQRLFIEKDLSSYDVRVKVIKQYIANIIALLN